MSVDKPNIACTAIKPAEANGQGLILRFNETTGKQTTATVTLPFLGKISSARETSLVEEDRDSLKVSGENEIQINVRPFGVKTVRVLRSPDKTLIPRLPVRAVAEADMQVKLDWKCNVLAEGISHFNIYRDTNSKYEPTLINYLGQTPVPEFTDKPTLNYGGWIRKTLEPGTTYYFKVCAVDAAGLKGAFSKEAVVADSHSI